jgi:threonine synthase
VETLAPDHRIKGSPVPQYLSDMLQQFPAMEEQYSHPGTQQDQLFQVEGTFDDCQDILKALFGDAETNKTHHLAAVNSINWARILAQITHCFYAHFQLWKREPGMKKFMKFVVPTGNFGYLAQIPAD